MEDDGEQSYRVFEDDETEEEDRGVSGDEMRSKFTDEKRQRRVSDVIDSTGDREEWSSEAGFTTPRRHGRRIDASSPDQGYSATPESARALFVPDWSIKKSDISDATPNNALFSDDLPPSTLQVEIVPSMPVSMDDERYNMNHKRRGKCVVFNHEYFDPGVDSREGSSVDAKKIEQTFHKLGFEVEILDNLLHAEVIDKITKLSQEDHSDSDCICIFVLTHGTSEDLLYAKDSIYKAEKIWKPFTGDRCKSLIGKPKLFFLQACRGKEVDNGVTLSLRARHLNSATDSSSTSYKIPTHADILITHSSVQGFYSWRNPTEGTWFVQCLCEVLDEYADTTDLLKMLTITARKISIERASFNDINPSFHDKKQVPSITTMLLRDVYFTSK